MTEEVSSPTPAPEEMTSSPETTPPTPSPEPVPEPAPAPAPVPLTVESLTLPEGLTLSDELGTSFLDLMNNAELSPTDRANALLELQQKSLKAASEAGSAQWEQRQADWQAEIAADPEIGGNNLPTTIANIGRLMAQFGSDEVRLAFDQTGAGNNPDIVRFLNKVSQALGEASAVPPGTPANSQRTPAQTLYGNSGN